MAPATSIAISDGLTPALLRRALIAARIIQTLDKRRLSTRDAERLTDVSHSEFSRIRSAKLGRFTLDRLIAILGKLDQEVEVDVSFKPSGECAGDPSTRASAA